ncbi:serine protease snake-like [Bradysia coprophila]|uniref:serine protease snake-like n=1 Tax=Bradysia coprophila TaxID=38358 RepID=UPI00187DD265|nr:serine protease snake-like [Bradysia coprophila]
MFIVCWKYIVLFGLVVVNGESLNDSENEATDRISIAKCTEYQKICPLETSPFNIDAEVAAAKEFPHMALIGYQGENKTKWLCSGSLISENFVLTAGHCASSRHHVPTHVRLGDLDFDTEADDVDVRQFNVTETFLYPDFASSSNYDDIALLKIDRTVDFSQYIQPACLPHLSTEISNKVVAAGWGRTLSASTMPMHKPPSILQKVPLNLVPFDVCKESYPPSLRFREGLINQTQLCAGSNPGERDTCAGFGGGPLMNTGRKFSCLYEIVGITSLGRGCGEGDPGVYTRLTSYIDWIEGIVWPEEKKLV